MQVTKIKDRGCPAPAEKETKPTGVPMSGRAGYNKRKRKGVKN